MKLALPPMKVLNGDSVIAMCPLNLRDILDIKKNGNPVDDFKMFKNYYAKKNPISQS